VQTGDLGQIAWSSNDFFLQVGIDATGGSAFTEMGTSQLLSVPCAMHSKTAGSVIGGNHSVSSIGDTLYLGEDYVIVPGISSSNGGAWNPVLCARSGSNGY